MVESAADRAIRLLDLVPFLNAHPGVKLQEVANTFGVTKQELIKDLNLLFVCGLPGYTALELIDLSFDDGVVVVKDPQNLDAPRAFTEQEALVVRIALAGLEDSLPEEYREKISKLRKKVGEIFKSEIPDSAITYKGAKEREVLQIVEAAIQRDLKIDITYLNAARDERSNRRISPMRVDLGTSRSLIHGWCDLAKGMRTFNISNIEKITLTDEKRVRITSESASDSYLARFAASDGAPFLVENRDSITSVGNGQYEIEIFQQEWLIRSALASAGTLELLAPTSVRKAIAERAQSALRNYR